MPQLLEKELYSEILVNVLFDDAYRFFFSTQHEVSSNLS